MPKNEQNHSFSLQPTVGGDMERESEGPPDSILQGQLGQLLVTSRTKHNQKVNLRVVKTGFTISRPPSYDPSRVGRAV